MRLLVFLLLLKCWLFTNVKIWTKLVSTHTPIQNLKGGTGGLKFNSLFILKIIFGMILVDMLWKYLGRPSGLQPGISKPFPNRSDES